MLSLTPLNGDTAGHTPALSRVRKRVYARPELPSAACGEQRVTAEDPSDGAGQAHGPGTRPCQTCCPRPLGTRLPFNLCGLGYVTTPAGDPVSGVLL